MAVDPEMILGALAFKAGIRASVNRVIGVEKLERGQQISQ